MNIKAETLAVIARLLRYAPTKIHLGGLFFDYHMKQGLRAGVNS